MFLKFFVILGSTGSKSFPGKSCQDVLARKTTAVSGTYWIKLINSTKPFQVYCVMKTHGEAGPRFTATPLQNTTVLAREAMP